MRNGAIYRVLATYVEQMKLMQSHPQTNVQWPALPPGHLIID